MSMQQTLALIANLVAFACVAAVFVIAKINAIKLERWR